jgi:hypothetical protein
MRPRGWLLFLALGGCGGQSTSNAAVAADAASEAGAAGAPGRPDVAAAVQTSAEGLRLALATACFQIASDLGADVTAPGATVSDQDLAAWCDAASAAIVAAAPVGVSVQGGHCRIDAAGQIACETTCSECAESSIAARCDPDHVAGACSGTCTGTRICEVPPGGDTSCDGVCPGTCDGTCSGTCAGSCSGTCSATDPRGGCVGICSGTCRGACDGRCEGTCTRGCELAPDATTGCDGESTCLGGCSAGLVSPQCEAELTPPLCDVTVDCASACRALGLVGTVCTLPQVMVGPTDQTDLALTLERNLPVILAAYRKLELIGDSVQDLNDAAAAEASATLILCLQSSEEVLASPEPQ